MARISQIQCLVEVPSLHPTGANAIRNKVFIIRVIRAIRGFNRDFKVQRRADRVERPFREQLEAMGWQ